MFDVRAWFRTEACGLGALSSPHSPASLRFLRFDFLFGVSLVLHPQFFSVTYVMQSDPVVQNNSHTHAHGELRRFNLQACHRLVIQSLSRSEALMIPNPEMLCLSGSRVFGNHGYGFDVQ